MRALYKVWISAVALLAALAVNPAAGHAQPSTTASAIRTLMTTGHERFRNANTVYANGIVKPRGVAFKLPPALTAVKMLNEVVTLFSHAAELRENHRIAGASENDDLPSTREIHLHTVTAHKNIATFLRAYARETKDQETKRKLGRLVGLNNRVSEFHGAVAKNESLKTKSADEGNATGGSPTERARNMTIDAVTETGNFLKEQQKRTSDPSPYK